MEIASDPAKDEANRDKHGVSLAFGSVLFDDPNHIVLPSIRSIDGESRYKVVGMADDDLWTAVYVVRGSVTRFISVRRSNDGEDRIYRT
ncbi:MAG: BrnT family toxin [Oxalobacteraceae bacterium]|nr:MAG: BrnT family toxin [Oxalobacteraceae bacterium]